MTEQLVAVYVDGLLRVIWVILGTVASGSLWLAGSRVFAADDIYELNEYQSY